MPMTFSLYPNKVKAMFVETDFYLVFINQTKIYKAVRIIALFMKDSFSF